MEVNLIFPNQLFRDGVLINNSNKTFLIEEFMFFNVVDAYVGPASPVFIERFGTIEEAIEDMEETDVVDYQQQTVK